jgi:hypothetical protein
MNITIEHALIAETVEEFYAIYAAAFEPLRTRAAARHLLTAEEFAEEMADARIDKYVARGADGEVVAIATLATDLAAIPWVSADYFAARYPEHLARGAVFYLGYTLVKPGHAGNGVYLALMEQVAIRSAAAGAVTAYDLCGYNDPHIAPRTATLAEAYGGAVERLDVQTYYAARYELPGTAA